ncbi:MAG: RipA family octameric membrane protein [Caulobacteraceae bacterium]
MADNITFDVYKLLVEEAREARRARRELSNIFLTLNLAGVGGLGLIAREQGDLNPALFAWCAFALILTCVIWRTSNAYYNKALRTKYAIITRCERDLGHTPLFEEYQSMGASKAMRAFTLERAMPYLFILGYLVFFVVQAGDVDTLIGNLQDGFADFLRRIGVD